MELRQCVSPCKGDNVKGEKDSHKAQKCVLGLERNACRTSVVVGPKSVTSLHNLEEFPNNREYKFVNTVFLRAPLSVEHSLVAVLVSSSI
jgi:hypothetical protein